MPENPNHDHGAVVVPSLLRLVGRAVPLVVRHTSRVALKLKVSGRCEKEAGDA